MYLINIFINRCFSSKICSVIKTELVSCSDLPFLIPGISYKTTHHLRSQVFFVFQTKLLFVIKIKLLRCSELPFLIPEVSVCTIAPGDHVSICGSKKTKKARLSASPFP